MPRFIKVPDFHAFPTLPTHQLTEAADVFSNILNAIEEELSSRTSQGECHSTTSTTLVPLNYSHVDDDRGYESPDPDDRQYNDDYYAQPETDTYNPPTDYDEDYQSDEDYNDAQYYPSTLPTQYDDDSQSDEDQTQSTLNYIQPETDNYPPTDYYNDEQYYPPTSPEQYDDDYCEQPEQAEPHRHYNY